jgi:hypothetical protein
MAIVAGISFERSAFSGGLFGQGRQAMRYQLRFSTHALGSNVRTQPSPTFSLTFCPESDISDSPYILHLIHMKHFLRGGMA